MQSSAQTPLIAEMLACKTAYDLIQWGIEHLTELHGVNSFFSQMEVLIQSERTKGIEDQAYVGEEHAALLKMMIGLGGAHNFHERLLHTLLSTVHTRDEMIAKLRLILPYITAAFFTELGKWADQSIRNNETAIMICETLLDLIMFNDLRTDWSRLERTLIWGAAWFMIRGDDVCTPLFNLQNANVFVSYEALYVLTHLSEMIGSGDMESLGLAILNVAFDLSPRAVNLSNQASITAIMEADALSDEDKTSLGPAIFDLLCVPCSQATQLTDMIFFSELVRLDILYFAAKLIFMRPNGHEMNSLATTRRIAGEAQVAIDKLSVKPMDLPVRLTVDWTGAAILDLFGSMALNNEEVNKAFCLHQQALAQSEAILSQAQRENMPAEGVRKFTTRVARSLAYLAQAELRLWRIDEACIHLERAIEITRRAATMKGEGFDTIVFQIWRSLGISNKHQTDLLQLLAKAELMRANCDRAEALLNEAMKVRQEGDQNA